ncbi:MAG: hypothetical protein J7J21_02795 [Methanomicrobia archaeon]|nr:hypothetical protein [Methanomicrobia archaeon]
MKGEHRPYVIFLPQEHRDQIFLLTSVFGSRIKLEILNEFCSEDEIYQKDLIKKFPYSNKTIIKHLKELVDMKILYEKMVKKEGKWVKIFRVTSPMKWIVLLLKKPETLPKEEMKKIMIEFLDDYIKNILKIAEYYGIKKKEIWNILRNAYGEDR